MSARKHSPGIFWFCLKFLVLLIPLLWLWWTLVPYYGQVLLQASGGVLKYLFGMPIVAGVVEPKEILNTGTKLTFHLSNGHHPSMTIALLVTNLPPYLALVLATGGLAFWKRMRILLYGTLILCAGHILFIIVALRFQAQLMKISEIPTATVQFFLTLPFMLWIVFAYWDKIMAAASGESKTPVTAEKSNSKPAE